MVALTRRLIALSFYISVVGFPIGFLFHYWAYRAERKAPDIEPFEYRILEAFKQWLFDVFDYDPETDGLR